MLKNKSLNFSSALATIPILSAMLVGTTSFSSISNVTFFLSAALCFLFVGAAVLNIIKNLTLSHFEISLAILVLLLIIFLIMLPYSHQSIALERDFILYVIRGAFPSVLFIAVYTSYKSEHDTLYAALAALSIAILFTLALASSQSLADEFSFLRQVNHSNVALSLVPFLFLTKRRAIIFFGLFFALLCVIVSLKRSGYLVVFFTIALAVIYLIFLFLKTNNIRSLIILFTVVLVSLFTFDYSVNNEYITRALERLDSLGDDGGSGRVWIFAFAYEIWHGASADYKVFGHTYRSFEKLSGSLASSAHNDVLDFLVDYGLLGLMLFVIFIFRVLFIAGYSILHSKTLYEVLFFISIVSASVVYTSVAGIFSYPQLFAPLFAALAILHKSYNTNYVKV